MSRDADTDYDMASIKDDISKMLEEAWNDQTVGEAFQSQVRGLISYELSHRVRSTMQRMIEYKIINEVVKPHVEARVKELEPEIKASLDKRIQKVLENIKTQLPKFIFEAVQQYTHNWVADATRQLTNHLEAAINWSFYNEKDEKQEAAT